MLGATDAAATGGWVVAAWSLVPGHEIVGGTITGFGHLLEVVLTAVGAAGVAAWLGRIGPSVLGGIVPVAAIWFMYSRGVKSWFAHDALERKVIRREEIGPPGLASARSEAAVVSGGLVAVIVGAWTGSFPLVLLTLAATIVVSVAVRLAGRRPAAPRPKPLLPCDEPAGDQPAAAGQTGPR